MVERRTGSSGVVASRGWVDDEDIIIIFKFKFNIVDRMGVLGF